MDDDCQQVDMLPMVYECAATTEREDDRRRRDKNVAPGCQEIQGQGAFENLCATLRLYDSLIGH